MAWRRGCALLAALLVAAAAQGQTEETRTLELEGGTRVTYTLRTYPSDAHLLRPAAALVPSSALDTAKLLNLHLSAGNIEEAALLSNAPRRRFEVLRDYREAVGEEEFKRLFAQYFVPGNRLLAEVAIGRHSLLIWDLKEGTTRLAGQYFVEVEGRYLMDDMPNDERGRLRSVLEAYRRGALPNR
jgi:hypothetical protein